MSEHLVKLFRRFNKTLSMHLESLPTVRSMPCGTSNYDSTKWQTQEKIICDWFKNALWLRQYLSAASQDLFFPPFFFLLVFPFHECTSWICPWLVENDKVKSPKLQSRYCPPKRNNSICHFRMCPVSRPVGREIAALGENGLVLV